MTEKKQEKKKDIKDEQTEDLKETLQRLQAEFENFRKRTEKEKAEFAKIACSAVINDILPILDSFEMALKNTSNHEDFVKGTEMIFSQFFSVLENRGVNVIDAEGQKFDPYFHEALMQEESDDEEGMIIEEFQKGYLLNGVVIRHSKVKVSKGKKEVQDDTNN